MMSQRVFPLPTSPVQCDTLPLCWNDADSDSSQKDNQEYQTSSHCCDDGSPATHDCDMLHSNIICEQMPKLDVTRRTEPVNRSELIRHNASMVTTGQRHNLWTVDTKRVYHGCAFYRYLKPYILAACVSDRIDRTFVDKYDHGDAHIDLHSDDAITRDTRTTVSAWIEANRVNPHAIVPCTKQYLLDQGVYDEGSPDEDDLHFDYQICTVGEMTGGDMRQRLGYRITSEKLLRAVQTRMTKRRLTQMYIEEKKPYNRIHKYISIFQLPKEIIQAAKDVATIGDVVDDPCLQEANTRDMIEIEPYLNDIRSAIIEYKMSDEEFDQGLQIITRSEFVQHNESLLEMGGRGLEKLWTVDGRRVYNGMKMYKKSFRLATRFDRSALNRSLQSSRHPTGLPRGSYGLAFQFLNQFHIPQIEKVQMKRQSAIGQLVEDHNMELVNQTHIELLLNDLDTAGNDHSIRDDFTKCILRFSTSITQGTQYRSWSGDINQLVFPIPNDVDFEQFRQWPDDIWDSRFVKMQWDEDWSKFMEQQPTCEPVDSIFADMDEPLGPEYVCSWRNTWEPLDTDIDGDVAWDELPLDVVKHDEPTETQNITERRRAARPGHQHTEWMAKRRQELFHYFSTNLRTTQDELRSYEDWADRMQTDWNAFQVLCRTWRDGYVQSRPSFEAPPSPMPWQIFVSPNKIKYHHKTMLMYFKTRKYVTPDDIEHYRKWPDNIKEGWKRFLYICDTWVPADIPSNYRYMKPKY